MRLSSNRRISVRRCRSSAGVALSALASVVTPRPAQAQWAVTCVNCSTTWTQLLEYAKEAQSLATQLQQYETQLQQYANMVTNTVALPQEVWGTVQSDIMQVQALSNAASLLSGNAGSIITRLQSASAYANQAADSRQYRRPVHAPGSRRSATTSAPWVARWVPAIAAARPAAILQALAAAFAIARKDRCRRSRPAMSWPGRTPPSLLQIQATLTATAQMQATECAVADAIGRPRKTPPCCTSQPHSRSRQPATSNTEADRQC